MTEDDLSRSAEAGQNGEGFNIEDLKKAQEAHLETLRLQREAAEQAAASRRQASEELQAHDRLRTEEAKLDDSIVGGISHAGMERDNAVLADFDEKLTSTRTELEEARLKLGGIISQIDQLTPLTEGRTEEEMTDDVKKWWKKLNSEKEALENQIAGIENDLDRISSQREKHSGEMAERHAPILKADKLQAEMKDITDKPEVMSEIIDFAEKEKDIRDKYIEEGVEIILAKGHGEQEPLKAQQEFVQNILQQYLDEEITRRGWDDLPAEERLENVQALTKRMVEGMRKNPYQEMKMVSKAGEIQALEKMGQKEIDQLHGATVKQLLGAHHRSPSGAIYELAYASSMEKFGEPINLHDIEESRNMDVIRQYKFGTQELRNEVQAYSQLQADIMAHRGTFSRLKLMADKQQFDKSSPQIYLGATDWSYGQGSMPSALGRLGINLSNEGIDIMDARDPATEEKYHQRALGHGKSNADLRERAKTEEIENQKQLLLDKEEELRQLEERIRKIKELLDEQEKLKESDQNTDAELKLIKQKETSLDAIGNEIYNWENVYKRKLLQKQRDFDEQRRGEIKTLKASAERITGEIKELKEAPRKRKLRSEEIVREIRELADQWHDASRLEYSATQLRQQIEQLRRTVEKS